MKVEFKMQKINVEILIVNYLNTLIKNIRCKTSVWVLLSRNFTWDPGDVQQEFLLLRRISF